MVQLYTSTGMNLKNDLAQKKHVTEKYMHDSIYYQVLKQASLRLHLGVKISMIKTNKKQKNDFHKNQGGDYFRRPEGNAIRRGT